MFEDMTEEYFMEQAREMGQGLGVDTRQGSVYMDAATGHCNRAAKFYNDMHLAFEMMFIDTCTGDVLEEKASEKQIYRKTATPAYYNVTFVGVDAADLVGDRFMVDGFYFVLDAYDDGYYLRSEMKVVDEVEYLPEGVNYITSGQSVIPVRNTMSLESATLGEIYLDGTDPEKDDSLRTRYKAAVRGPAENGNKQQYKTWCEEFDGVGRAILTSLAYGPNTLKALIIASDGTAPTSALIDDIQEVIDPGHEGLGEGKAYVGCQFYAEAAVETPINIVFNAVLASGYTQETALAEAKQELTEYLKNIALNTSDADTMLIQYVKIVGILADTPGIKDFSNLLLNGNSSNINIGTDNVGVLGEVTMNVGV